ncbi:MAG: HAMP domain-containing histidine kinase [Flavobacteriaceae bacterium]|nr:HAMP domain-containing histidine kinase [Flavobacteriaceae bacterium]
MFKQKTIVLLLLFLQFICTGIAIYFWIQAYWFSSVFFLAITLFCLYRIHDILQQQVLSISQILQAMVKKDFSVKTPKRKLSQTIYKPLEALLQQHQSQQQEQESVRIIYQQIIDATDSGILILKKTKEVLFYSNPAFFELLEVPQYTKWHLAKKELKAFDKYLNIEAWRNQKDVLNLYINGKEEIFAFRTYTSTIYGTKYLIANLDPLQNIIDKKEKEAWFNLMKVMSHEILNTISPIHGLTQNLTHLVNEKQADLGQDYEDIHQSVITIRNRSQHLRDFVETYRHLAELPSPIPQNIYVSNLLEDSCAILSALIEEKNVALSIQCSPSKLQFDFDKKQMEQVLINLITNSIYALTEEATPKIEISAVLKPLYLEIQVKDNGCGIPEGIKKEVFVPFFTTRENGSGIGLSLSKNIVQAHGGTISFQSNEQGTSFYLRFPIRHP